MLVNAARVGAMSGMHAYTQGVLRALAGMGLPRVAALVTADVVLPDGVERVDAPSELAMRGVSSWRRSVAGWAESRRWAREFCEWHVLSTTHLGLSGHGRQILTVHDLRPVRWPDSLVQQAYFRWVLPQLARRADGLLTVSEASKREIVRACGVGAEHVFVVPNVVRLVDPEIAIGGGAEPYLLMVNAGYIHKNARAVLEKHTLWSDRFRLKILAADGAMKDWLREQARRLGIAQYVDFLPRVTDAELAGLYQGAAALVYPSLTEGFGLPPLEAMAQGTPVMVSDIEVFHETLGDAAIYVRLGDAESWRAAFAQMDATRDSERIERARAIALGYTQERMTAALRGALGAIWPELF